MANFTKFCCGPNGGCVYRRITQDLDKLTYSFFSAFLKTQRRIYHDCHYCFKQNVSRASSNSQKMNGPGLTEEQKRKIQENKLRALARRIEKQSPVKQTESETPTSQLSSGLADLPKANNAITNFYSAKNNVNEGGSTLTQTSIQSNNKSAGPLSGKGKLKFSKKDGAANVRGKCVYVGKDTFSVEVGYSAALIQYFKQLKTRQFGEFKMNE